MIHPTLFTQWASILLWVEGMRAYTNDTHPYATYAQEGKQRENDQSTVVIREQRKLWRVPFVT